VLVGVLYLAIVLAVVAVAILIWGLTRAKAASTFSLRAAALDERAQSLESDLAAANDRVGSLEKAVQQANERADQQTQKARESADEARRSDEMAEDAVQRAVRAETDAEESKTKLAQAEAERLAAIADRDATIAGAGPLHPDALWQLEERRVERLWRDRLALQPDEPSPFAEGPDALAAALRVLAEASREESGVVIDLRWDLHEPLRNDRRVQLVRIGEELVAAMRDRDGGSLEVADGARGSGVVELRVRTSPAVELSPSALEALRLLDVEPTLDGDVLVIAVPPRGEVPTGADAADAAGADGADVVDVSGADDGPDPTPDPAEPPSGESVAVTS
jgi:hypothetical protein